MMSSTLHQNSSSAPTNPRTSATHAYATPVTATTPMATLLPEERDLLLQQLARTARRAKLLTRTLTRLYMALAIFIATSVSIGVVAVAGVPYAWIALGLGFIGAMLLFWASLLLILESRISLTAVFDEMDFVQALGRHYAAPGDLVDRPARRRWRR